MELYKLLAEECEIEKNSTVIIPDEPLRTFVRLIIMDQSKENIVKFGYVSGLFDGTGNISPKSVEKYHEKISDEVKKLQKENNILGIHDHFGVGIEYFKKKIFKP